MPRKVPPQVIADARSTLEAYELNSTQDVRRTLASSSEIRHHLSNLVDEEGPEVLKDLKLPAIGTIASTTLIRTFLSRWPLGQYEAPCPNGSLGDAVVDVATKSMPGNLARHVHSAALLCTKAELQRALEHLARSMPAEPKMIEQGNLKREYTVNERENIKKYGVRKPLQKVSTARTWQDVVKALGSVNGLSKPTASMKRALDATARRMEALYGPASREIYIKNYSATTNTVADAANATRVLEKALSDAAQVDNLLPRYSFGPQFDDTVIYESHEDYIPGGDNLPNGLRPKDQYILKLKF
ncbi:hypothetical protein MCUN1_001661 [Malassezia cuniculi]|uniref:Uncharacterized protein n=1 Tax=Malassezia cuniculi TaxID=948313 RepID=A0AAF0EUG3_9BASI|nr:hypothetical protein MCUN1_001661 [Malassezia cuniculi]